ncbi:MAG: glycosyltransferase family A protein [Syntrophomonas sp.]
MDCKISVIIPTMQRSHLLKWNLYSLSKQIIPWDFETIVLNDGIQDETENICEKHREQLNLKYVFTGQRNLPDNIVWRVPGFAFNIGVKMSQGDILILCDAEMYHLNDTIAKLVAPLIDNPKLLGIPVGYNDANSTFLNSLEEHNGNHNIDLNELENGYPKIDSSLPYLMSISKNEFLAIGGYDEDFTGVAADDDDLVRRLRANGCIHHQTDAQTIHLYHPRIYSGGGEGRWDFNLKLFRSRMGRIVRNEGREWGKFEG